MERSLGRQRALVSDAGHELRTPLAVLRMELELADRPGRSREELAEAVSYAAVEADRLSQLADDLLFLARADEGESLVRPQPTDLGPVLHNAARSFRTRAEKAEVALVVDVPDEIPALADAAALRRAVDNVLSNALEHSRAGGRIRLAAAWGTAGRSSSSRSGTADRVFPRSSCRTRSSASAAPTPLGGTGRATPAPGSGSPSSPRSRRRTAVTPAPGTPPVAGRRSNWPCRCSWRGPVRARVARGT